MSARPPHDAHFLTQLRETGVVIAALAEHFDTIAAIAARLSSCLDAGGTIYLCGNGGSAADAQHVAAELVGRFLRERQPLPAVALTCNTSLLTAIANDYDFTQVFARQVRAHAGPKDCVVGISTSGRSRNVLEALAAARNVGASTVGMTSADGHELAAACDDCLLVPSSITPRIQEAHLVAWHLICDVIERSIPAPSPTRPEALR